MEKYTKEQILNKIKDIVNNSDFLSKDIISYAENIKDEEKLNKLLVIVYNSFQDEKKLNQNEKEIISKNIVDINKNKIDMYKIYEKKIREEVEKLDYQEDNIEDILLNI